MRNKIWMNVVRYFELQDEHTSSGQEPKSQLHEFVLEENQTSEAVVKNLTHSLGLPEYGIVLKMRNHRGSLIPINSSIMTNSKTVPYTLEVVREHQHVKPKEKSRKLNTYQETMKEVLMGFEKRLDKLERKNLNLTNKQKEKNEQDMEYLEQKIAFLNKRFDDAEKSKWVGMFKKNPLW